MIKKNIVDWLLLPGQPKQLFLRIFCGIEKEM
jgi:hypothetical protein